ncbi:MAG: GNAT family N-acetyltransferase [Candidatus Omnitrophica bacterium]|nr:GNAT family N-acetyltransferase [Candidatus Omnitrophota bacterium]
MSQYTVKAAAKLSREEVVDFLARIYGPNYHEARRVFECVFDHEPSILPQNFLMARDKRGVLIGLVRIVDREVLIGGICLRCGVISSVAVHPSWRGQGVCSRLMRAALDNMRVRKFAVSTLHARKVLDGFYAQFGYYGIGRYVELDVEWKDVPAGKGLSVRAMTLKDIPVCRRLRDRLYTGLAGSYVRDAAHWAFVLKRSASGGSTTSWQVIVDKAGVIGYLVRDGGRLVELCLDEKHFTLLSGLLCRESVSVIKVHPRHPFFLYCRRSFNTSFRERFALDGGYMGRIIDADVFWQAFKPLLPEEHLLSADTAKEWGCSPADIRALLGVEAASGAFAACFPDRGFYTSPIDEF